MAHPVSGKFNVRVESDNNFLARSPVVTRYMIVELSLRIVAGSIEERVSQEKLTDEWIVFAKESNGNY
ncbi:MAG: hypothetical protein WC685_03645 [Methylobacter sp.]